MAMKTPSSVRAFVLSMPPRGCRDRKLLYNAQTQAALRTASIMAASIDQRVSAWHAFLIFNQQTGQTELVLILFYLSYVRDGNSSLPAITIKAHLASTSPSPPFSKTDLPLRPLPTPLPLFIKNILPLLLFLRQLLSLLLLSYLKAKSSSGSSCLIDKSFSCTLSS